jgi:hypothetical protein
MPAQKLSPHQGVGPDHRPTKAQVGQQQDGPPGLGARPLHGRALRPGQRRPGQDDTRLGPDVGKADQDAGGPCGHGVVSGQVGAWRVGLGIV